MHPNSDIPATTERSNREWVLALQGQASESARAYEDLRRLLGRVLTRALRHRALGKESIADLVQDALIKIVDALPDFRGDSRFTTWACAVAVRTAFTALRRAHWHDLPLDAIDLDSALLATERAPASAPELEARRVELTTALLELINEELTARQREVILGELADVPQEVLLARLEIGRNALYKLAHDARRKLKFALERAGISRDDVSELLEPSSYVQP